MTEIRGHWICITSISLRQKLGEEGGSFIKTVRGVGYRLVRSETKGGGSMGRAILKNLYWYFWRRCVLTASIFYLISSHMILKMAREDMTYTIEMIDRLLDYEDESYLAVQIERMEGVYRRGMIRGVTLIHLDGTVVSDTDTYYGKI